MGLNQRNILFLVGASVLLLLGLGSLPQEEVPDVINKPLENNVTLGYIATTDRSLPKDSFLITLAEEDINEYCVENDIPWRFNFKITCAYGKAQNAHDITMKFAKNGTKLVGGYGWSSFLCSGSRTIANDYNMTLVSIASTSPIMAVADTAFRLCPNDLKQVDPVLVMLDDLGVSSLIIIQRGDSWGDFIVDELKSRYNGTIVDTIRYAGEVTEFSAYLNQAQTKFLEYNASEKPDIMLVSFSESRVILTQAVNYPHIYNRTWFGTDSTAGDDSLLEEAGKHAAQVKLYSPALSVQPSQGFDEINQLYNEEFNDDLSFLQANAYDCCWLMANCVIDTNTTDGAILQSSILEVASNHTGITGDLSLDENGDRLYAPYEIWGYFHIDGEYVSKKCGFYDPANEKITWDHQLLETG